MKAITKTLCGAALLAASAALADAACIAYVFTQDGIPGTTNITDTTVTPITKSLADTFGGSASLTIQPSSGKLFGNQTIDASGLSDTAVSLLTETNSELTSDGVKGIAKGLQTGAGGASVSFVVSGLSANTDYTVTMLVSAGTTSGTVSWSGGTLVSGSYASTGDATTISEDTTSFSVGTTSALSVSLTLTTDSTGSFTITAPANNNSGNKTQVGYFAISDAIPEPSAFGLFVGIGALALAATRRRRHSR